MDEDTKQFFRELLRESGNQRERDGALTAKVDILLQGQRDLWESLNVRQTAEQARQTAEQARQTAHEMENRRRFDITDKRVNILERHMAIVQVVGPVALFVLAFWEHVIKLVNKG